MLLFVGLGNPGADYAGHRHNVGFLVLDAIAARHGIAPWRRRFQGVAAEGSIGPDRVLLLKPATYMNDSGRAVAEGAHIGNDYRRVRIGVGHPGDKDLVQFHVLSPFAKSERAWVAALCEIIADNAALLAKHEDASFQNRVHLAMAAKGFVEPKTPGAPADGAGGAS